MGKVKMFFVLIGCILASSYFNYAYSQGTDTHADAIRHVENWLSLVDKGAYEETWDDMSEVFRKTITKKQWIADLKGFRAELGKPETRKLSYVTPASDPDAGPYLIIQYQSSFANNITKGEAVSVIEDDFDNWKILGYSIF